MECFKDLFNNNIVNCCLYTDINEPGGSGVKGNNTPIDVYSKM